MDKNANLLNLARSQQQLLASPFFKRYLELRAADRDPRLSQQLLAVYIPKGEEAQWQDFLKTLDHPLSTELETLFAFMRKHRLTSVSDLIEGWSFRDGSLHADPRQLTLPSGMTEMVRRFMEKRRCELSAAEEPESYKAAEEPGSAPQEETPDQPRPAGEESRKAQEIPEEPSEEAVEEPEAPAEKEEEKAPEPAPEPRSGFRLPGAGDPEEPDQEEPADTPDPDHQEAEKVPQEPPAPPAPAQQAEKPKSDENVHVFHGDKSSSKEQGFTYDNFPRRGEHPSPAPEAPKLPKAPSDKEEEKAPEAPAQKPELPESDVDRLKKYRHKDHGFPGRRRPGDPAPEDPETLRRDEALRDSLENITEEDDSTGAVRDEDDGAVGPAGAERHYSDPDSPAKDDPDEFDASGLMDPPPPQDPAPKRLPEDEDQADGGEAAPPEEPPATKEPPAPEPPAPAEQPQEEKRAELFPVMVEDLTLLGFAEKLRFLLRRKSYWALFTSEDVERLEKIDDSDKTQKKILKALFKKGILLARARGSFERDWKTE